MIKAAKRTLYIILSIFASFFLVFCCTSSTLLNAEPPSEARQKLEVISKEEKEVLQKLFTLVQEISALEKEEQKLLEAIDGLTQEISAIEGEITHEMQVYARNQKALSEVLQSYQRMGPGSYLEIIMKSDSLTAFLRRINTLRDMTRNTGKLMAEIQENKEKLAAQKTMLEERLAQIEEKRRQSEEALRQKQQLELNTQQYLASLKGQKEYYEKYLAEIQVAWDELKPFFTEATAELSDLIKGGALPEDAIKLSFSLFGLKGTIDQKSFNDIISQSPKLAEMSFAFHQGSISMNMASVNLILSGRFVITDGNILKLEVDEGSFYGMPLEPASIEELLSGGELIIDFKPILGNLSLKSIDIKEGCLELLIR